MHASISRLFPGLLLAAILSACGHSGGGSTTGTVSAAHGQMQGVAHGGQSGIVGATVTVYAVGSGGGATQIASTTSLANGAFSFPTNGPNSFSCSAAGESNTSLTYVTVTGGSAGSLGANSAISLVSVLGPCQSLPSFVNVDEVSTAAAAYALSGFLTTNATVSVAGGGSATGTSISASSSNGTGLANAFATANTLVNTTSGGAASGLPQATTQTLYALSNSLAACVNTGASTSGECTELFACALPGAAFSAGACTGGSGSVADTLSAALSVTRNPGTVSISGIYDTATRDAVFSPTLSAAPNDWTLSVNYSGGGVDGPYSVAIDAAGNVWLANDMNPGSVTELGPTGAPAAGSPFTGGGLDDPLDLAIDTSGKVWISNSGNNSVTELVPGSPATLSQITSSQFSHPYGIAVDTSGNIWVANQGNSTLSILNSAGVPNASALSGGGLSAPLGVAAVNSGVVWVSNGNSTASDFSIASQSPVSGSSGDGAGVLAVPAGLAGATGGGVLIANEAGASMSTYAPNGTLNGTVASIGGLDGPFGVAVDSLNNRWLSNRGSGALTKIGATALSPSTGFAGSGVAGPAGFAVAVDASGNVWMANHDNGSVTEFIGAAAPTRTPLAAALISGYAP